MYLAEWKEVNYRMVNLKSHKHTFMRLLNSTINKAANCGITVLLVTNLQSISKIFYMS